MYLGLVSTYVDNCVYLYDSHEICMQINYHSSGKIWHQKYFIEGST